MEKNGSWTALGRNCPGRQPSPVRVWYMGHQVCTAPPEAARARFRRANLQQGSRQADQEASFGGGGKGRDSMNTNEHEFSARIEHEHKHGHGHPAVRAADWTACSWIARQPWGRMQEVVCKHLGTLHVPYVALMDLAHHVRAWLARRRDCLGRSLIRVVGDFLGSSPQISPKPVDWEWVIDGRAPLADRKCKANAARQTRLLVVPVSGVVPFVVALQRMGWWIEERA